VLDARTILGVPAWLKPLKFALSTAIYSFTFVWIFSYLPEWRSTRRVAGFITAAIFVIEVGIIDVQVWRGTTSHFNTATVLDGALYTIMGVGIFLQTLASLFVAIALWRQTFTDPVIGWAFRLGMTMTLIGASTGGLMTRPTAGQIAEARVTHNLPVAGAHTVGAADGGPGLPGTGWSTEHGDLRVPHFVGLHAIQALAIVALVIRRRHMSDSRGVRAIMLAAASYAVLFAILLSQALRGEPAIHPEAATQAIMAAWAIVTTAAMWMLVADSPLRRRVLIS
jgi:hypothetical protein